MTIAHRASIVAGLLAGATFASWLAACVGDDNGPAPTSPIDSSAPVVDSSLPHPDAGSHDATGDLTSGDSPADSPVDSPIDSPIDAPPDSPIDSSADSPADAPNDGDVDAEAGCGEGTILASSEASPGGIAVDGTYVYWLDTGTNGVSNGTLKRAPLSGIPDGGAATILASGLSNPTSLVIDGQNAYWTNVCTSPSFANGGVMQMPLAGFSDGGAPLVLSSVSDQTQLPSGVALGNGQVFWTQSGPSPYVTGLLRRTPIGGGAITNVATAPTDTRTFAFVRTDATRVYWTDQGTQGSTADGKVLAAPIASDGGAPTVLAPAIVGPYHLAVGASDVYVTTPSFVYAVPLTGVPDGGAPTPLASSLGTLDEVVLDGAFLYVTDEGTSAGGYKDGRILKIPIDGSPYTVVACNQVTPTGIAVDAARVYWAGNQDGTIRAATK